MLQHPQKHPKDFIAIPKIDNKSNKRTGLLLLEILMEVSNDCSDSK